MHTRILGGGVLPFLIATALLLTALPAHATTYAVIEGTGSTGAQVMVDKWVADVDAQGIKVVYTGGGSSKGRKDFAQYSVDFAVSDLPYQGVDENGQPDTSNGREYAYLPFVAGGTSLPYHLEVGGRMVTDLRLSRRTVAGIFTGAVRRWNDPAILRDNPNSHLPRTRITPVVRAEGSGSTWQFTSWLDATAPQLWADYKGSPGATSYFPARGNMIAAAGSDQLMSVIRSDSANGTIGYVESAYPRAARYPVAALRNKSGHYVLPTAFDVTTALKTARINTDQASPDYLTAILDEVYTSTAKRAYPISSYAYLILPTGAEDLRMTTEKRQTLAAFVGYALCGGQVSAADYGYAPLPDQLVAAGLGELQRLHDADSAVTPPTACH